MKIHVFPTLMAAWLAVTPSSPALAYMKLGDIKGEATEASHREWSDLDAISVSITRHSSTNAAGAVSTQSRAEVTLSKALDKSSPKLIELVATGRALTAHEAKWDLLRQTSSSASTPLGVKVRSVKQPGGKLGIQWTPEPGRRYTLRQSPTPEGPYAAVQEIEPVTTPEPEPRWVELPPGLPFVFFVLEEHE